MARRHPAFRLAAPPEHHPAANRARRARNVRPPPARRKPVCRGNAFHMGGRRRPRPRPDPPRAQAARCGFALRQPDARSIRLARFPAQPPTRLPHHLRCRPFKRDAGAMPHPHRTPATQRHRRRRRLFHGRGTPIATPPANPRPHGTAHGAVCRAQPHPKPAAHPTPGQ